MWKDKSGITSLRLCFPQEQLKRSHGATRLFRAVEALDDAREFGQAVIKTFTGG